MSDAPTIDIPLSVDVIRTIKRRRTRRDTSHQIAEAELGNLIHGYYVGQVSNAAASGEALENFRGTFFSQPLPNKDGWCLHAAVMGHCVVVRAGYLIGLSDAEPVPQTFPDEIAWIFSSNKNEVWAHVFKEDIAKPIDLAAENELICRVRFSIKSGSDE